MGLASWSRSAPPAEVSARTGDFDCVVAVPARDEAALIARCLLALSEQQSAPRFAVVLFINNCRDDTAQVVASTANQLSYPLYVFEADLPAGHTDAAWSRRLALNAAAELAHAGGVVLTTDADSFASPDWISACMDSLQSSDVVCGFVAPDFSDAPALDFESLRHLALEYEYSQLSCELLCRMDPDPDDPWPRHQTETGANLGVHARHLRDLGGIPHICPGEDEAFVRMAEQTGLRVRHAFRPQVTTSSRLRGRAEGGWSDDLRARTDNSSAYCHKKLEPAARIRRRALLRAASREQFGSAAFLARAARLLKTDEEIARVRAARSFREAWAFLEARSPILAPQPLRRTELAANFAVLTHDVNVRREQASESNTARDPVSAGH